MPWELCVGPAVAAAMPSHFLCRALLKGSLRRQSWVFLGCDDRRQMRQAARLQFCHPVSPSGAFLTWLVVSWCPYLGTRVFARPADMCIPFGVNSISISGVGEVGSLFWCARTLVWGHTPRQFCHSVLSFRVCLPVPGTPAAAALRPTHIAAAAVRLSISATFTQAMHPRNAHCTQWHATLRCSIPVFVPCHRATPPGAPQRRLHPPTSFLAFFLAVALLVLRAHARTLGCMSAGLCIFPLCVSAWLRQECSALPCPYVGSIRVFG